MYINMRPHSHSPVHASHLIESAVFIYLLIHHSLYWIPIVSKPCAECFIWISPLILHTTPEMRIPYLHCRRRKLGLGRLSDLPENPKLVYYADLNSKRNILLLSLKRLMYWNWKTCYQSSVLEQWSTDWPMVLSLIILGLMSKISIRSEILLW